MQLNHLIRWLNDCWRDERNDRIGGIEIERNKWVEMLCMSFSNNNTRLVDASLYLQIEECEEVGMFLLVARPLLDAKTKLKIWLIRSFVHSIYGETLKAAEWISISRRTSPPVNILHPLQYLHTLSSFITLHRLVVAYEMAE